MELKEKAADFTLKGINKDGEEFEFTLSNYAGKPVVLFFYPGDFGSKCTLEAQDFSDHFANLSDVVEVAGISMDDLDSHREFIKKYDLKIPLLSDPDAFAVKSYGICEATDLEHKEFIRSTFLIDKEGKIAAMWKDVNVNGHAEDVLMELKGCE